MDDCIFEKENAFGLMPFETIYFQEYKPHFLMEHYKRLKRACRVFGVEFNYEYCDFEKAIIDFIQAEGEALGAIKLVCYKNKLKLKYRTPDYEKSTYLTGLRLSVAKTTKDKENIFNYFKTFNLGINYMEDTRAKKKGFHSVLFLNIQGHICETAYANIFFRSNNILYTPDIRSGILNGVMRSNVIKEAKKMGFEVKKVSIELSRIQEFSECFITNSLAGVFPVSCIENYKFEERNFLNLINKQEKYVRLWNK